MAQATHCARVFALVCLTLFTPVASAHASMILYQQAPDFPSPTSNSKTSYGDPSQDYFRVYDNFALTQPSLVTGLTWQGTYSDFVTPTNNPATPNTNSFQLAFWADTSGSPGALLYSLTVPIAAVNTTFVGLTANNLNVFNYQVDLTTAFLAQSGTQYWLSIFSNSSSFTPLWAWRSGVGGDGTSFQTNLRTGVDVGFVTPDRAFSLTGQVVPEPSSLVLMTLGLAGAVLRGRQRSRRSVSPPPRS